MSWTDKTIYADVRLTIEREQMRVDLSIDNRSAVPVYVPDVSFLSTKEGIKVNPAHLPLLVNRNNALEATLFIAPLDPNTQWATPPTFFTHIIPAQGRYQRQWILPYPVRIAAKDNQGMVRTVPISTEFIVNLGVIQPPASYKPKEVPIDGHVLYEFGQEALRFQTKQPVVLRNQSISMRIDE